MKFRAALLIALLTCTGGAAPGAADIEKAGARVAAALDGVLRNCPASFAKIGSAGKKCVGASGTVEQVRVKLGAALSGDLYSVWRSRDEQRSVYNWVKTPGGYVYLRLQADPDGRAQTLVYVDAPPDSAAPTGAAAGSGAPTVPSTQIGSVTLTPAATPAGVAITPPTPTTVTSDPASSGVPTPTATPATADRPPEPAAQPAPALPVPVVEVPVPDPPIAVARGLGPVPFTRPLLVQARRLSGSDVLAVQNRLIALMRPARAGQGDGWYGPVTAQAVRAFQKANRLPVTGQVDQATWTALFSADALPFTAPGTP